MPEAKCWDCGASFAAKTVSELKPLALAHHNTLAKGNMHTCHQLVMYHQDSPNPDSYLGVLEYAHGHLTGVIFDGNLEVDIHQGKIV